MPYGYFRGETEEERKRREEEAEKQRDVVALDVPQFQPATQPEAMLPPDFIPPEMYTTEGYGADTSLPMPRAPTPLTETQKYNQAVAAPLPAPPKPKWWQRALAGGIGALQGYAAGGGRVNIRPGQGTEGILGIPQYQERLQRHMQDLEQKRQAAQLELQGQETQRREQEGKQRAEMAGLDRQIRLGAMEAEPLGDGETVEPEDFTVFEAGGKKYKRPTAGRQARLKKEAEVAGYIEIPTTIAQNLRLPVGTKIPPTDLDAYVRMFEAQGRAEEAANLRREIAAMHAQSRSDIASADRKSRETIADVTAQSRRDVAGMYNQTRRDISASAQPARDYRNTAAMARDFRNEKSVKDYMEVKQAFEGMVDAARQGKGVGDTTLMRLFAKLTDPTTGVREEEYRTFENAAGTLNRFRTLWGKWTEGQRLLPDVRQQFVTLAGHILKNREKPYRATRQRYEKQASTFNVDPTLVFPEEEAEYPAATARGSQSSAGPTIGTVENGYRFKGGDPSKPENWEKVAR